MLILFCGVQKILFPTDDFPCPFHRKKYIIPWPYHAPFVHLTTCTPSQPKSYLANSLATAVSESGLHRLLTFHIPNLMSPFHCLGLTKGSFPARDTCIRFVRRSVFTADLLALRPTPILEDHALLAVRYYLFNIFVVILHIEGRSYIRNMRTRHDVVTGAHLSRVKVRVKFTP